MHALTCSVMMIVIFASATTGCGEHPTPLLSGRDIHRASKDTEQIVIGFLPIEDYPLLSKFYQLKDVSLFTTDGTGANDQKLEALSKLGFDKLRGVTLLNCPAITDVGIRHLSRIKSLKWLGLEGTSITGEALEIISKDMKLTSVNVANCSYVTLNGLMKLARSETLTTFTFPAEPLTQEDVVRLIMEFKPNLKWPAVVDLTGKLNASKLEAIAQQRGFNLNVRRTGAMQDLGITKAQSPTGGLQK